MMRDATPDDIGRMVELGARMHAESPVWSRLRFSADRLAASIRFAIDRGFAKVLEDESGKMIGGMLAAAVPHWFSEDAVACDMALFIEPEHRGGMAAARLLNAYAQWARGTGAALVQFGITTGVHTEATQAMCERLGWRQVGALMEA
jgi:GNAT superfamily N-acetyltransferase